MVSRKERKQIDIMEKIFQKKIIPSVDTSGFASFLGEAVSSPFSEISSNFVEPFFRSSLIL
jgi:hypothetical protein